MKKKGFDVNKNELNVIKYGTIIKGKVGIDM